LETTYRKTYLSARFADQWIFKWTTERNKHVGYLFDNQTWMTPR